MRKGVELNLICLKCGKDAPNRLYCINCGEMRPREPDKLRIEKGALVTFDYYGKRRTAIIRKVLKVNVKVQIMTNKRELKTVKIPIKKLKARGS